MVSTTLGAEVICRWIKMSEGHWEYVCFRKTSGGGHIPYVNNTKTLGQTSQSLMNTYYQDLSYALQQIQYYENEIKKYPESTEVAARLQYWKDRAAALQKLIGKGVSYIRKKGSISYKKGGSIVEDEIRKLEQQRQMRDKGYNANMTELQDMLDMNYAGLPLWAWLLLAGGGIAVALNYKKKK